MKPTLLFTLWFLLAPLMLVAQTSDDDDIQVTASFASSLDLTITSGSQVNFVVATTGEYTGGVASPYNYFSDFTVTASTSFKVILSATDFNDGEGNTLPAENFGYRLYDNGTHVAGVDHLLLGGVVSPSALAILGQDTEIITPMGNGNAGTAAANTFRIHFELGTPATRALSGLPSLLEQGIAPATYSGVVTLTAMAMP
ncbi:MAG: hypothetical protein D6722_22860 [Bacteroidetes bacterium]|nr:MAG: hypothetical protein D6722_22860 [Bacteroidota bacterium]